MRSLSRHSRQALCVVIYAAAPLPALAHTGAAATSGAWWTQWSWEPAVLVSLALTGWLYRRGVRALWRETTGRGVRWWEALAFTAGWLLLWIALISPLHSVGRALFCAHMLQHEVLMLAAAPLLMLGRPLFTFLWALPRLWRQRIGRWSRRTAARRAGRLLTLPLTAWTIHAAVLWIWHAPALFQATLQSDLIHTLQHLSFLFSALLLWWALLHGGRGWMGYGAATLYVFTTSIHSGALGALLTFSSTLWYPRYQFTTAAWGLTPLEDQQLGGLFMWVPAGVVYLAAGLALMADWLRRAETHSLAYRQRRSQAASEVRPSRQAGVALSALCVLSLLSGCEQTTSDVATAMTGGDVARGRAAIRYYGCPACHTIPGVPGANGLVGPPLVGIARRVYLGGVLLNTPENMINWIRRPQDFAPRTAMPNSAMSEDDARDIAGYLYTLR